jgi:hypothetical protein
MQRQAGRELIAPLLSRCPGDGAGTLRALAASGWGVRGHLVAGTGGRSGTATRGPSLLALKYNGGGAGGRHRVRGKD